jgi:isoleucyl-tRNA synthetase
VYLQTWYELPEVSGGEELLRRWALVREVRGEVQRELEALRVAGRIGSSLQAEVEIHANGARHAALAALGGDLRFAMITSQAKLVLSEEERIVATASEHRKCERCWHYRADVGVRADAPGLCGRCVDNLFGAGETRSHA